jgi:hypothetical protein
MYVALSFYNFVDPRWWLLVGRCFILLGFIEQYNKEGCSRHFDADASQCCFDKLRYIHIIVHVITKGEPKGTDFYRS